MREFLGFLFGLSLCLILTAVAGENAAHVLWVIAKGAIGSRYDFGMTLFYTTSLIFTGLAVSLPFRAGLFNIGAEGQLTMGTLAAAAIGYKFAEMQPPWAPAIAILAALLGGGAWGLIAGWLRAYRKSHEVVITMMLNFIAAGVTSYFITHLLQNPNSQNPESAPVGSGYLFKSYDWIAQIFPDSAANLSLVFAVGLILFFEVLYRRSIFGYELLATGQNEEAARLAGIDVQKIQTLSLALAGAIAGLVALNEVLGSAGKLRLGFSADYGFIGIAVALTARNRPLGIILSALLFGILQKGTSDLDLETQFITRDFSRILQAIIILSIVAFSQIDFKKVKVWIKKIS